MSDYRTEILADNLLYAQSKAAVQRKHAEFDNPPLRKKDLERAAAWDWLAGKLKELLEEEQTPAE